MRPLLGSWGTPSSRAKGHPRWRRTLALSGELARLNLTFCSEPLKYEVGASSGGSLQVTFALSHSSLQKGKFTDNAWSSRI